MKKHIHTFVIFSFALCIGIAPKTLNANTEEKMCKGKACVDFGGTFEKDTPPMEKALKGKLKNKRYKEKKEKKKNTEDNKKCKEALDLPDDPDDPDDNRYKENQIQKFCKKSPKFERETPVKKSIIVNGKQRGKRIKNKTTLIFKNAKQRYGHEKSEKWSNLVFKKPKTGDLTRGVYKNSTNTTDKSRKKMFFVEQAETENDDHDCIDRVTGEHIGGKDIPNDDPASCFQANGELKKTLTAFSEGCVHDNGTILYGDKDDGEEDDCYNAEAIVLLNIYL